MYFSYYFNFIGTELIISHNKVSIGFEYLLNRLFKLKLILTREQSLLTLCRGSRRNVVGDDEGCYCAF